ncbi:hypothetical protein YC2023_079236 [Brassica napus]
MSLPHLVSQFSPPSVDLRCKDDLRLLTGTYSRSDSIAQNLCGSSLQISRRSSFVYELLFASTCVADIWYF